jgi:hypothetical protein
MKKMSPEEKAARNAAICERYLAGETLAACGRPYGFSRQNVKHIVKEAGLWRARVPSSDGRDAFLGINITPEDKEALKLEAERQGLSMSALSSDWIREKLDDIHSKQSEVIYGQPQDV